jgi:3-hydroxyisobutyrate dehydrogenase
MLTVMCGGDAAAFDAAKPAAMAFARAFTLLGAAGSGQLAKMVNQICIAGLVQGLSEAIAFGQKAGLDMEQVLDVIGKGAAQSWQMDNRGKTMIAGKFDFGFAVDWMRKDLGLVLDEAKRNGARLPVTALVDQFYADVQALGWPALGHFQPDQAAEITVSAPRAAAAPAGVAGGAVRLR